MNEATLAAIYGVVLGLSYGVSSYLTFLWAMKLPGNRFIVIVLGGMLVRMTLAFAAVAVLTRWMAIAEKPFFLGFLVTFLIVLTLEIGGMHKGTGTNKNIKSSNGSSS